MISGSITLSPDALREAVIDYVKRHLSPDVVVAIAFRDITLATTSERSALESRNITRLIGARVAIADLAIESLRKLDGPSAEAPRVEVVDRKDPADLPF